MELKDELKKLRLAIFDVHELLATNGVISTCLIPGCQKPKDETSHENVPSEHRSRSKSSKNVTYKSKTVEISSQAEDNKKSKNDLNEKTEKHLKSRIKNRSGSNRSTNQENNIKPKSSHETSLYYISSTDVDSDDEVIVTLNPAPVISNTFHEAPGPSKEHTEKSKITEKAVGTIDQIIANNNEKLENNNNNKEKYAENRSDIKNDSRVQPVKKEENETLSKIPRPSSWNRDNIPTKHNDIASSVKDENIIEENSQNRDGNKENSEETEEKLHNKSFGKLIARLSKKELQSMIENKLKEQVKGEVDKIMILKDVLEFAFKRIENDTKSETNCNCKSIQVPSMFYPQMPNPLYTVCQDPQPKHACKCKGNPRSKMVDKDVGDLKMSPKISKYYYCQQYIACIIYT